MSGNAMTVFVIGYFKIFAILVEGIYLKVEQFYIWMLKDD